MKLDVKEITVGVVKELTVGVVGTVALIITISTVSATLPYYTIACPHCRAGRLN
jgi:hypothetical protein